MPAAYEAFTADSRKAQQKMGKLVNRGRHTAHTSYLGQLPGMARPAGPDDPLFIGGRETRVFVKAHYWSLQRARAAACLRA